MQGPPALSAGLPPCGGQGSLVDTLREVQPTSHMGVPRVWEKIMERIQEVAARSGFIRRKMLLWAMSVTLEQNLACPSRYREGQGRGTGARAGAGQGVTPHSAEDGTGWACPGDPVQRPRQTLDSRPQSLHLWVPSAGTDSLRLGWPSPPREQPLVSRGRFLTSVGGRGRGHSDEGFSSLQATPRRSGHCL